MKKILALLLVLAMLLCACGETDPQPTVTDPTAKPTTAPTTAPTTKPSTTPTTKPSADPTTAPTIDNATEPTMDPADLDTAREQVLDTGDLFSNRDMAGTYDTSDAAVITLNGDSVSCNSRDVHISGTTVTLTDKGTYIISGTLNDGMIIVDTGKDNKVQIVLNGASITSSTSAPIYVRQADKVFITTVEGTENYLANGGEFIAIDENSIDATIFSKEDLTLNGFGSLTIESPAGHGVVSKDELTVTGGTYVITTASHGLNGKDNVCIAGGNITIAAGKDGIQADFTEDVTLGFLYISGGTFDISAEGDGISASGVLQIDGGTFDILAGGGSGNASKQQSDNWGAPGGGGGGGGGRPGGSGGGSNSRVTVTESSSMKGIKSGGNMVINGGTFSIDSADDGIHSNINATITGGTFTIASGDDGVHAEEELTISDGNLTVTKSYEGLEALHVLVSGGKISLKASDDGINAAGGNDQSGTGGRDQGSGGGNSNGSITIAGGDLYISASGDNIDANGSFTVSGGHTVLCGPTQGDTSVLDYDLTGTITGGTVIGTGAVGFGQGFTRNNQGYIFVRVSASANTAIILTDLDGNVILEETPALGYNVVLISTPELVSGQEYYLKVGSALSKVTAK